MYKIVVVEDEKRVRQGIIMGTDWSKINCIVMGEAENGEEAVEKILPLISGPGASGHQDSRNVRNGGDSGGKAQGI